MRVFLFSCFLLSFIFHSWGQGGIPLRPKENYDLKIDYDFKKKPVPSIRDTNYALIQERNNVSLLPHLTVFVNLTNRTEEEVRVRVVDNYQKVTFSGKIKEEPLELVLGYMVDIKEKVSANRWEIIVLTKKKDPIDRIVLEITEDGTFYVNNVESGNF